MAVDIARSDRGIGIRLTPSSLFGKELSIGRHFIQKFDAAACAGSVAGCASFNELWSAEATSPCGGGLGRGVALPYHRKERDLNLQGQRDPPSLPSPTRGEGERLRFDRRTSRARRQALERGQAFGKDVEGLLVDREDRHLRSAVEPWVVQSADLEDHERQTGPAGCEVRAAGLAEFARDRLIEVAAGEGLRLAARIAEPFGRHQHEQVGAAASDILAFAAEAFRPEPRLALGNVADFPAIAAAFEFHAPSSRCDGRNHKGRAPSREAGAGDGSVSV